MAFPSRFEQTPSVNSPINPQQRVLAVPPLNSVPYCGPPLSNNVSPTPCAKSVNGAGPAMIFLPSHPPQGEWEKLITATKGGVGLTGSAYMGKMGPMIGLVDIGECEDSYFFRVSLPGVARDSKDFSCDIDGDGKILIKGVTTTGEEVVCKNSQVFKMRTQNLCPPGPFSLSLHLPGPVEHSHFSGSFGTDGILEGIVKKKCE